MLRKLLSSQIILPVALLLIGALLLLQNSATLALWSDEAWSAYVAQQTQPADAIELITNDFHPPLYFLGLNLWRSLAGEQVIVLRYLSVLLAMLTGAVAYRFVAAYFRVEVALIALLLFFLHDLVLVLGQEVRPYALAQLLTVLTIWQYQRFWEKTTLRRGVWFALSGAALLWTLYWGGFILLALGIHALITRYNRLVPFILANAAIGLSFLPWVPTVLAMFERTPVGLNHTLPPTTDGYAILIFQMFGAPELFWLVLAGFGVVMALWARHSRSTALILVVVVVVTIGVSVAINLSYQSLSFRSLSILLPLLAVLIARGIANFRRVNILVVLLLALVMSLIYTDSQPPPRIAAFDDAVRYLSRHSDETDLVISEMQWESMQLAYNLNKNTHSPDYRLGEFDFRYIDAARADFDGFLAEQIDPYDGIWLVSLENYDFRYDMNAILQTNAFQQTGALAIEDDFLPIQLTRYDRLPEADPITGFENGVRLNQADVEAYPDGVSVNLMWDTTRDLQNNYTVSVLLLDSAGQLAAQQDNYPLNGSAPTATWETDRPYYDTYFLPTADLPSGEYEVGVQLYLWTQEAGVTPVYPTGCEDDACRIVILDTLDIGR